MLQDTLRHVLDYLEYLQTEHHLQIYLRPNDRYLGRLDPRLMLYNSHRNPYCLLLKSNHDLWEACIRGQEKVCQKCADGAFFGMCHAGVEEFVYPLGPDYREKGFLSVTGYRSHPEEALARIRQISEKYRLDAASVEKMYRQYLSAPPLSQIQLDRLIHPLCDMLDLLFRQIDERDDSQDTSENNTLYDRVIIYLGLHYSEDISLQDLCERFHCSASSLSHMFKKKSGKSIRAYLNFLRIQEATALLQVTDLPIQTISAIVGVPDSNYFSNLFRKEYGISPMDWRNQYRHTERSSQKRSAPMKIKAVLFDLDGTLLPMDQDTFVQAYFRGLAAHLAPHGYEPKKLVNAIWQGTEAMIANTGEKNNETAFWNRFAQLYDDSVRKDEPIFAEFYRTGFQKVQEVCGFTPEAAALIHRLKEAGLRIILATNPIFPAYATASRIQWAGLQPGDFELYTTYENIGYCKPNLDYYREILRRTGLSPEECLMVGNDVGDDMVAKTLGISVFLLTDCLINKTDVPVENFPHGGFEELNRYLDRLIF